MTKGFNNKIFVEGGKMNTTMIKPRLQGTMGVFIFEMGYYSELEKLSIGGQIKVEGFKDESDLIEFTKQTLKISPQKYKYTIDESDLTYTIERVN